jgi:transposase
MRVCACEKEMTMKDTALYEQLLGLQAPWFVQTVDVDMVAQEIRVRVGLQPQVWADPTCASGRAHVHGWHERRWRHLDTCQMRTIIVARVPQLKYSDGTVEELSVPWAGRYERISTLMQAFVLKLLQACSNTQRVAELTGLSWDSVNDILRRAVARGLQRRTEAPVMHLGLDEKSIERGHSYATVLTDIDARRVLEVVPGRTLQAARTALNSLSQAQRHTVRAVAMDMWPAYMGAARDCVPQAEVVHDRFHVSKYLNEAVDRVRRQEHKQLARAGSRVLSGTKYDWLRRWADGRSAEAVQFRALHRLNLKTSRAWRYKESFVPFWAYRSTACAKRFFDSWAASAMRSRLPPLKAVVTLLRGHQAGLLAYSRHGITNACAEGFNSVIQLLKTNARGFRNFENYRARILFACGKLEMAFD